MGEEENTLIKQRRCKRCFQMFNKDEMIGTKHLLSCGDCYQTQTIIERKFEKAVQ
jgi:hypothetical protein